MKKNILNNLRFLIGLLITGAGILILRSEDFEAFYGFVVVAFGAFIMAMTGPGKKPDFEVTIKKA